MENTKWVIFGLVAMVVIISIYIFTRSPKKSEKFSSGLGLGSSLSVAGIGPAYEGFTMKGDPQNKEGFCGACS